jgi:hypothetical protein
MTFDSATLTNSFLACMTIVTLVILLVLYHIYRTIGKK